MRNTVTTANRIELERWLNEPTLFQGTSFITPELALSTLLQAQLECALAWLSYGNWIGGQLSSQYLQPIAKKYGLSPGIVTELARTLNPTQAELTPHSTVNVTGLLYNAAGSDLDRCVVADVILERLPGTGQWYPALEHLLTLERDSTFIEAERNACVWLYDSDLWPLDTDVRWRIRRQDGESLPFIAGPSLGGAFALGLARLLVTHEPYSDLDLEQLAVTAEITTNGQLQPVGKVWHKLLGEEIKALAQRKLLRTVVVADGQEGIPAAYLTPEADLYVVPALSVKEATERLIAESLPWQRVRQFECKASQDLLIIDRLVPLTEHYQVLPLLQEVKKEALPRVKQSDSEEDDQSNPLSTYELLRWEEDLRVQARHYQRVELNQVFSDFARLAGKPGQTVPRFFVLGPPGSGKTTLVQYLAYQAATDALTLAGRKLAPVRVRLPEWEAKQSNQQAADLPSFLAKKYDSVQPEPCIGQWRRWLQRGTVLLLLDGMDEVANNEIVINLVKSALRDYPQCPTVLTCRTVSFEDYRELGEQLAIFTLAGLDTDKQAVYIEAYPVLNSDRLDQAALIRQLHHNPAMQTLASNPLLLAIVCYVLDDPEENLQLPATRCELYNKTLNKLLKRQRGSKPTWPQELPPLPLSRQRRILARTALELFASTKGERKLRFSEDILLAALTKACASEGRRFSDDIADHLLSFLTQHSGVLRGDGERGYFFLHLTLQEYLAASSLAQWVNKYGWDTPLELGGVSCSARDWLERKSWDRRWQEVIILWVGQLDDPATLLSRLADASTDDVARHRLCLATRCLSEISDVTRESYKSQIDLITEELFTCWWMLNSSFLGDPSPAHWRAALPILVFVDGSIGNRSLLELLVERLSDKDWSTRTTTAQALGALGASAATSSVMHALKEHLNDHNNYVRVSTVTALGKLGQHAATATLLEALIKRLNDDDDNVRASASTALGKLVNHDHISNIHYFLEVLARRLDDSSRSVSEAASQALIQLAKSGFTTEVMDILSVLLRNENDSVREEAIRILTELDVSVTNPEVLHNLAEYIQDCASKRKAWTWYVEQAIKMIGKIEKMAVTTQILNALAALFFYKNTNGKYWYENDNYWIQEEAKTVLRTLGMSAVTPEILDVLKIQPFVENYSPQPFICVIQDLGVPVATSDTINIIASCLGDDDYRVRRIAVWTLEKWEVSAPPKVLDDLLNQIEFGKSSVCSEVILGLVLLAPTSTPRILNVLVDRLGDADYRVRGIATWGLSKLGVLVKSTEALESLLPLVGDKCTTVRQMTREALEVLNIPLNLPRILDILVTQMNDPHWEVRETAILALSELDTSISTSKVIAALRARLYDENPKVCLKALTLLKELNIPTPTIPEASETLLRLLNGDNRMEVRQSALKLLNEWDTPDVTSQVQSLLITQLHDKKSHVRYRAIETLGMMRAAATSEIINALVVKISDEDGYVMRAVVEALGRIGPSAATSKVIDALKAKISDENFHTRYTAVKALGRIGPSAATPEVINVLIAKISDEVSDVRYAAVKALSRISSSDAVPKIVEALVLCIDYEDFKMRELAKVALIKLSSSPEIVPDLLDKLTILLKDTDKDRLSFSENVLCRLGALAATSEILSVLAELSNSKEQYVRSMVARMLGILGVHTATPEVIGTLTVLTNDSHMEISKSAIRSLRKIGDPAATPEVLRTLLAHLFDAKLHDTVLSTLDEFGSSIATPEVLESLVIYFGNQQDRYLGRTTLCQPDILKLLAIQLYDKCWNFRQTSLEILPRLGRDAITPEILNALGILLSDESPAIRRSALGVISDCWERDDFTPEILNSLALRLSYDVHDVRMKAMAIVRFFGCKLSTPGILDALASWLFDPDRQVRSEAIDVLNELKPPSSTPKLLKAIAACLSDKEHFIRSKALDFLMQLAPSEHTKIMAYLCKLSENVSEPEIASLSDLFSVRFFRTDAKYLTIIPIDDLIQ